MILANFSALLTTVGSKMEMAGKANSQNTKPRENNMTNKDQYNRGMYSRNMQPNTDEDGFQQISSRGSRPAPNFDIDQYDGVYTCCFGYLVIS